MSPRVRETAAWMHAAAAALSAAGMDAQVHSTRGVLDITRHHREPRPAWYESHRGDRRRRWVCRDPLLEQPRYHPRPGSRGHCCRAGRDQHRAVGRAGRCDGELRPMTGQADVGRRPGPGLGGTGRVADELYLMTHHELAGRAHLAPRAVGLGLAGALLAELILADAITVEAGTVTSAWPGGAGDTLTGAVAGQIVGENPPRPVGDWLAFLARTAAQDVASRLVQAGYLAAELRRPWRAGRWVPVDADCAHRPSR
jgi:hypothetical protein